MLDGQEDIKNEADIQAYLDSVADSFKTIREFAKANKNSELTVMASDALYHAMEQRYISTCEVKQVGYYKYETNCPDVKNFMEVSFNRADIEAIQQIAAGYELYFSLANSYDLSGSIDKAVASQGQQMDGRKVLEELLTNKNFATLRSGNGFQKVKAMGVDAIAGIRWIMKNQNTLCPMGSTSPRNRLGMLLGNGICTNKENAVEDSKNISLATDALAGKIMENVEIGRKQGWEYVNGSWKYIVKPGYMTSIKPISIFDTPIADLRNVLPTAYDRCGNVVSVKDASVAGLFVKSDANLLLAHVAECN